MTQIRLALLVIVATSIIALPLKVVFCRATGASSAVAAPPGFVVPEGANLVGLVNQSGFAPDILNFFLFDDSERLLGGASKIIGITNIGNVVIIDPQTGIATTIARVSSSLVRGKLALDFDSDTRMLRIMGEGNLFVEVDLSRVPPLIKIDTLPTYAADDSNAGNIPKMVGLASNKTPGSNDGNIFVIDSEQDILAVLDGFKLKTIGPLGVKTTSSVGFSAMPDSPFAFASLLLEGEEKSRLYIVNLISGLVVEMGSIGVGGPVGVLALLLGNKTDVITCDVNPSQADLQDDFRFHLKKPKTVCLGKLRIEGSPTTASAWLAIPRTKSRRGAITS
jgi:hypothetical protein